MRIFEYEISFKRNIKNTYGGFTNVTGVNRLNGFDFNLLSNLKFSKILAAQILKKLFDGMSGVVWQFTGTNEMFLQVKLKQIYEKDFIKIYNGFWNDGYIYFAVSTIKQDIVILCDKDFRINEHGFVLINQAYSDYKFYNMISDNYKMFCLSDAEMSKDMYCQAEDVLNASNAAVRNLGAMGILSPDNPTGAVPPPLNPEDKKELQDDLQNSYGLNLGKWTLLITSKAMKFTQIALPIKDLELNSKVELSVKLLAGFHGIPYELLPIAGNSTYQNREEARIGELLNITCRAYANKMQAMAEEIFLLTDVDVTYNLENAKTSEQITAEESGQMQVTGTQKQIAPVAEKTSNQTDLKSTVGGVQGILSIQQSVSSQTTDYEAAIQILVIIYGFTDEQARKILGTPKIKPTV